MTPSSFDDLCVIVRECGERTADACAALAGELLGVPQIHRVSGRPFVATLRRSLELGASVGRAWTLCIDADVLVLPGLIDLIAEARALPTTTFAVQGLVFDKLLMSRRPAGNHLYRTALIPLALPLIPSRDVLRPEMDMIGAMAAAGLPCRQSRQMIGLHDFEQSFSDIYGKAFLHAHKHRELKDAYQPIWTAQAEDDEDFVVALKALADAEAHDAPPIVCRDFTDRLVRQGHPSLSSKPAPGRLDQRDVASLLTRAAAGDPLVEPWRARIQAAIDRAVFGE
jgi:hypothetical protein